MAPSKTIPWRKDIFTPAFTGLLDQSFASGATAAYSLRKLKSSASRAVRVREDSGNTETDIGFSGGTLDETALLNHCGSANGFVTKWYDQSGNGNEASNSNASKQPQIVNSGTVVKENGKPALQFDGDELESASTTLTNNTISFIWVQNRISDGVFFEFGGLVSDGISINEIGKLSYIPNNTFTSGTLDVKNNTQSIIEIYDNGTSNEQFLNGSQTSDSRTLGNTGTHPITIGNNTGSSNAIGMKLQEFLIYPDDQFSNRSKLRSNINSYYSVF